MRRTARCFKYACQSVKLPIIINFPFILNYNLCSPLGLGLFEDAHDANQHIFEASVHDGYASVLDLEDHYVTGADGVVLVVQEQDVASLEGGLHGLRQHHNHGRLRRVRGVGAGV